MAILSILGILSISVAIIYLIFHYIRKKHEQNRVLSKNSFLSFLNWWVPCIIVGFFIESETQSKLINTLEDFEKLEDERGTLKKAKMVELKK